ncbi:putative DNA primase, eukaryotic-type, small subunit [Thermoplasmatales archaeon BRNA1]|nr:putative DNA primase, eukaryotic-type, small subunit [Thermoplasmatales archaeon BRNA1]
MAEQAEPQKQKPFASNELDSNSRFLYKLFRRYYRSFTPDMPDRFTKKEFGFIPFGRTMQRHMAFTSQDDLKTFMMTKVPAHSYYSTAYYRHPSRPVMEEKEWMGAELIFDLDADHLQGADEMTYSEMMVQIRREMIALCDDYLFSDLGFSEDQVHICFSGGRGYHAHIRSNDIYTLGANERRELVDYISCTGLDLERIFPVHQNAMGAVSYGNGTSVAKINKYRLLPAPDEGGWKHKMREALKDIVKDIREEEPKRIKKLYPSVKSQNSSLEKMGTHLRKCGDIMFERGTMVDLEPWEQEILMKCLNDVAPRLSSEVDKPVTPDIKRLIRLPGSLHGKTGLRVTPITRDQLTDYDPLQSAVPDVFTSDPVKVTMRKDMSINILGEDMSLKGETEVPEFAAPFLVGRKYADYGWKSQQSERLF